ncbi:DUF1656 domain-containing protein [Bradyrhizobium cenepequi]|jgi:hypothetical protein
MPFDLDIYGVYLPGLVGLMLAAYVVTLIIRSFANRIGLYPLVWHPALFDLSIYVLILGALFSLTCRLISQ